MQNQPIPTTNKNPTITTSNKRVSGKKQAIA